MDGAILGTRANPYPPSSEFPLARILRTEGECRKGAEGEKEVGHGSVASWLLGALQGKGM